MDIETVTLHGGPKHGAVENIPAGYGDTLQIEVLLTMKDIRGKRKGEYTRVHKVDGRPEPHFEWVGYSSPFVAIPA